MSSLRRGSSLPEAPVSRDDVRRIGELMGDPPWVQALRIRGLEAFLALPLPSWSGDLSALELGARSHVPHAEPTRVSATPKPLAERGVIVADLASAVHAHEELVRGTLASVVPAQDNTFAALNAAVWTGGWFIYVPAGVALDSPLVLPAVASGAPAGRFERTLVLVGEGAEVHLVETSEAERAAPGVMHALVTELVVRPGARCRFTALQRAPATVFHLATRRAVAGAGARVRWDDVTLGGRLTMQYPSVYLRGPAATGEIISLAVARPGQHQDTGAKLVFEAPGCRGRVLSRALSFAGGRTTQRALVKVARGATAAACRIDEASLRAAPDAECVSHPYLELDERDADVRRNVAAEQAADGDPESLHDRIADLVRPVLGELDAPTARLAAEALG